MSVSTKQEEFVKADEHREREQLKDVNIVNDIAPPLDDYEKELRRFLIPKLRSASYRWYYRNESIKKARKSRGIYECAICKSELKNGEYIVDHKDPVVPLEGWDGRDWSQYVRRMFCKTEGFQILCHSCSDIKTDTEVQIRKMHRERRKKQKNS